MRDAVLVTLGRHLRVHDDLKVIVGRNEAENQRLAATAAYSSSLEFLVEPGPTMLLRGIVNDEDIPILGGILRFFAKKTTDPVVDAVLTDGNHRRMLHVTDCSTIEEINRLTI